MINTNKIPQKIENILCKNCNKNNFDTVLKPCNHVCLCSECVEFIIKCPVCRIFIKYFDKIFLPSN